MKQKLNIKQVGVSGREGEYAKFKVAKLPTDDWREYYENYVLQFGKYKEVKVTDMKDGAQTSWLLWYYRTITEKESNLSKKANITYRVIKWYLHSQKLI